MAFLREKVMLEMQEFQLIVENYPTDTTARFEVAQRMFQLGQFQEAIPVFQQVRNDPKYQCPGEPTAGPLRSSTPDSRTKPSTRCATVLDEYPAKGDDRSKEMYYWYGRALENHQDFAGAIKQYSQVAQVDFNYRDVQDASSAAHRPASNA